MPGRARAPQFDLHAALQERGIHVETEVRLPATSQRSRSGYFFVDLAVYREGELAAVCECKSWKRELVGRQRENYDGCGVPYIVAGSDNFTEALMWLAEQATKGGR